MAISNFLNPIDRSEIEEKQEEINKEEVLQEVILEHLGLDKEEDKDIL